MSRAMTAREWDELEAVVRRFCELREEYRRRKESGTLGGALENRMIQSLNSLEVEIDRMKSGNEIARARARQQSKPSAKSARLRKAQ